MIMIFALAALAAAQAAAPVVPDATQAASQPGLVPAPVTPLANPAIGPSVVTPKPLPPAVVNSVAPAVSGPVLWRNITSGMPVSQLRGLYAQAANVHYKPDRTILSDVPILDGCEAKVNVLHPAGVVQEIVMRGEGSLAGRCSLKLITALSSKYGESLEKDKVRGSLFAREGKNYVWTRDGITLQFKRYTNGPLGGGGLFAASWELRYSATPANIDL